MLGQIAISVRITAILLVICCGLYPLLTWGIGRTLFRRQADGSLIRNVAGQVIGSELLAQDFTKPEYFHPRPSAAGAGYDAVSSGGTNLGPTSAKLIYGIADTLPGGKPNPKGFDGVKTLAAKYRAQNGLPAGALVPVDAVTRSASGLDPEIGVENARLQAPRVAKARGMPVGRVDETIAENTRGRAFGFLGEPGVNVLELNLALDRAAPASKAKQTHMP